MRRALAGLLSVAAVVVAVQANVISSSAAPRAHGVISSSAAPRAHGVISSSAAPRAPAAIVCPFEPAGSITCCAPPISRAASQRICCVGAAAVCCPVLTGGSSGPCPLPLQRALLVTITSRPNPSSAGRGVTIRGTSRRSHAGAVALWQELPGQTKFHKVATAAPNGTGAFKFVRGPVETNVRWYVVAGGVRSNTVSERVTAVVTIVRTVARPSLTGGSALLIGQVTPNHAGEKILLQKVVRGAWRTVASARINRASRYVFGASFHGLGRVHVRAVLPADGRNVRSASRVLTMVAVP